MVIECVRAVTARVSGWHVVVYRAIPDNKGLYRWHERGAPVAGVFHDELSADGFAVEYADSNGISFEPNVEQGDVVKAGTIANCVYAAQNHGMHGCKELTVSFSFTKEGITGIRL